ncbi:acyltransferase family protein [Microbulbifer sp. SH-1]|uniref:acyltransferase family protein n=1 Tax=Microbulbifer sp. SH-1 TaxID=2681547 RepID=UPI00140768F8|nr:acyltransferase [Microbulbifer sp. SH-1]QIL91121.1 acyltransferase family protein [Microbulbifer sp. SH-1]
MLSDLGRGAGTVNGFQGSKVVRRIDRLDALRGIAALLVVWQHTSESFVRIPGVADKGTWLADVAWSVDFGRIGVVCFFLISGFIIPHSFSAGAGAVKKFAVRRFFRLYPVYWFSIFLAVFTGAIFVGKQWTISEIGINLTMFQSLLGMPHIQGLYWTLQVELVFYILCGFLFYIGKMHDGRFLTVLAGVFLSVFVGQKLLEKMFGYQSSLSPEHQYIPYLLAIMLCGTILREVLFGTHTTATKLFFLMAPATVFGLPALALMLHAAGVNLVDQPIRFGAAHLIALGVFCMAIGFHWRVPAMLAWSGVVSYSVYLFHPVAMTVVHWLRHQTWASFTGDWALWGYMAVAITLTMVIAIATYYLIERPAIEAGRRLSRNSVDKDLAAVA